MKRYRDYVSEIESITRTVASGVALSKEDSIRPILDGQPREILKSTISTEKRRKAGAFFTPKTLAEALVTPVKDKIRAGARLLDPACGAGDLLLACTKFLPVGSSFEETIRIWGTLLQGRDINEQFIRTTRARLILAAASRRNPSKGLRFSLDSAFPDIKVANSLEEVPDLSQTSLILLNPPFLKVKVTLDSACFSKKSLKSQAAIFLEKYVSASLPDTEILAILPDVLRSGSFYKKWREWIGQHAAVGECCTLDQFDKWTDIHVFTVRLARLPKPLSVSPSTTWWEVKANPSNSTWKVADLFQVHVGPVVPHRDRKAGTTFPFIHAKALRPWGLHSSKAIEETRRFKGRVFNAPFVVIRRTSRPEDSERAIATIVQGDFAVAVENHLIVCSPRSEKLADCRELLKVLRSAKTSDWLNNRIRCRHLTVSAIKELPWGSTKHGC